MIDENTGTFTCLEEMFDKFKGPELEKLSFRYEKTRWMASQKLTIQDIEQGKCPEYVKIVARLEAIERVINKKARRAE